MVNKVLHQNPLKGAILVICIILVSIISSVIHADIVKHIVDTVVNIDRVGLFQVLGWLMFITVIASLLKLLIAKWIFFFKKKLAIILEDQGIVELYNIQTSPTIPIDEVMSLIQNSVERVVNGLLTTLNDCIITVTQIIATVIYSLAISWEMVVLCFLVSGIMLVLSDKNNKQIPLKMKKVGDSFNKGYSIVWDHIHNAEVSSFLNKNRVFAHLEKTIKEISDNLVDANRVQNATRIFSRFASIMIVMITALYGGFMAINYGMKISNILALILILQVLADSIFKIPALVIQLKGIKGEGHVLDKLYNMVLSHHEELMHATKVLKKAPESLTVQSIFYKPEGSAYPISIVDSLMVQKGQILCVAGASGSGKTTFLNICAGLLPDYQGTLCRDKTNLKIINREFLWKQMCIL